MEIHDMKEQILAKLRAKRESAASNTQANASAVNAEEMLEIFRKSAAPAQDREHAVTAQDEELRRQYEALKKEFEIKCAESKDQLGQIQDLRKKLDAANQTITTNEEVLKVKDKKTSEVVRLMRELESARKVAAEYQSKAANVADANRKISNDRDEALKQYEKTRKDFESKDRALQDLEKRLKEERSRADAISETIKVRDKKTPDVERLARDLDGAKKTADAERARFEALHIEYKKVIADRDDAAKLLKKLRSDAEARERAVQDLQKRLGRMAEIEETLRTRDKRLADADRLAKELDTAKRTIEEYRMKCEAAQGEIRSMSALRDEAAGQCGMMKEEIAKRDVAAEIAQKKFTAELDEIIKDRDRVAANVESLRSKLYVATKETKEQLAKIAQLEEASRIKDKRSAELDKANNELVAAKNSLETKLQSLEIERKNFEGAAAGLKNELTSKETMILQLEKMYKEIEAANHGMDLQLQARERNKKDLEAKIEQMNCELDAKTNRLTETDKIYKELDTAVNDLTARLQASQREKKELESSHGDISLELQNTQRERKDLEARMLQFSLEIEAKTRRLAEADKLHAEMETIVKDSTAASQTLQRRVGDLEKEVASLSESLKGTLHKLKETEDSASREMERLTAEMTALKNIAREKERKELEYRSSIEHLETEVQMRDSKIEGDIKYTDKVVKEVTELRKKLAALERQARG